MPINPEHPPLAKELIAAGILLAGDTPRGWRLMSNVFGALSVVGLFLWALQLFSSHSAAIWVALIASVNQGLYVQSRIAMLDIFLLAFLVWAFTLFTYTWTVIHTRRIFAGVGVCLGFAVACKWVGLAAWTMVVAIVIAVKVLQKCAVRVANPSIKDWYRADLWQRVRVRECVVLLGFVPLAAYGVTFLPEYGFNLAAILRRQIDMWNLLTSPMHDHSYMSRWYTWPLMVRPVWYEWQTSQQPDHFNAVAYLSNPLITWAGLPAIGTCLYGWMVHRHRNAFVIFWSWFSLFIFWALAPRAVTFSFYYLPSLTLLSLALSYVFYETKLCDHPGIRRGFAAASVAVFIYFLPLLASGVGVTQVGFDQRMWFGTWP